MKDSTQKISHETMIDLAEMRLIDVQKNKSISYKDLIGKAVKLLRETYK